jgi:hypothetical protein
MESPPFPTAIEARDWLRNERARAAAALAAAKAAADAAKAAAEAAPPPPPPAPAITSVIQDFLSAAALGGVRDRAGEHYSYERVSQASDRLVHVDAAMGRVPIDEVRRVHVQALIDRLGSSGMPGDRVVAVVGTLSELFIYAIEQALVDFTPVVHLRLPEPASIVSESDDGGPHANGHDDGHVDGDHDADDGLTTYVPAATLASSDVNGDGDGHATGWTPGALEAVTSDDQPFGDEPTYGVQTSLPDEPPIFGPYASVASAFSADARRDGETRTKRETKLTDW